MKKQELSIESIYFLVTYLDEELLAPKIETYLYIGKDILQSDNSYYFQDAETYYDNGKWQPGMDAVEFRVLCMKEDFLENVFDYSGLQYQIELIKEGGAKYYE